MPTNGDTMAKTIEQQIAEAEKKLALLRERRRSKETREKIIAGAVAISEALRDPKFAAWLVKALEAKVTKEADKTDIAPLLEKLRAVKPKAPEKTTEEA